MAASPVYLAACEYVDRGLSVIPVGRDKKPLVVWEQFQHRQPTDEELAEWFERWPEANVAIITGQVSGLVVVDADGEQGMDWLANNMPVTGVYARTGKGVHGYFRLNGQEVRNRARLAPEVDVRGEGGYVVAPPSMHASGKPYEFVFPDGMNGWDGLADFDFPAAKPSLASGGRGNLSGLGLEAIKPAVSLAPAAQGQRNATLARLAGRWAQKGLDFDEVLLLAKAWNAANNPPLGSSELERTVRSICETHLRNHGAPEVEVSIPGPAGDEVLPSHVLAPGGLLQGLMEYVDRASAVSHQLYNLAGAIVTVGTLLGQKVCTETGLRTNIYAIALGHSGSGKDSPQGAIPNLLSHTRAHAILGPNTITSDAAMLKWLSNKERARSVFFLDEIGLLMQALKKPMSPAAGVPACLMKLFSGTDRGYIKPYSSGEDLVVDWHHLSFYGASTPGRWWEGLTRSEATDGFMARLLVFESRHDVQRPKSSTDSAIPAECVEAVNAMAELQADGIRGGNLQNIPNPHVVGKTPEAMELFTSWAERYHTLRNDHLNRDEGLASIYGRAAEHAHKLALIHAASLQGPAILEGRVGVESVRWAAALVDWVIGNTVRQMADNLSDNEWHAWQQRILRAIRAVATTKKPGATKREIMQRAKGLTGQALESLLKQMQEAGDIVARDHQGERGPAVTIFCRAKENP